MSYTWGFLIIAMTVPAAAEEAEPRVGISFKDCPLTYAPLVGRIVEIELGLSLLDPAGSDLDFQSEVACRDDKVELKAGTPAALGEASQLDLSGQRATDRPRIIGLKLASLLEQRLADWTPPANPVPAAPPPPPAPAPPEPVSPQVDEESDKPAPTPPEPKVAPKEWKLVLGGGMSSLGQTAFLGPFANLGGEWTPVDFPLLARVDAAVLYGTRDVSTGSVDALVVGGGASGGYIHRLGLDFDLFAAAGYRFGHAVLRGHSQGQNRSGEVSGFWHGPLLRVGASYSISAIIFALEVEAGFGVRPFRGEFSPDGDAVNLQGPWLNGGVMLKVPLL